MLATEVTENTEVLSFAGATSAANSSRSDGLFAAKAAPTFTVVQIKTTKQAFASMANNYRINPLSGEDQKTIKGGGVLQGDLVLINDEGRFINNPAARFFGLISSLFRSMVPGVVYGKLWDGVCGSAGS